MGRALPLSDSDKLTNLTKGCGYHHISLGRHSRTYRMKRLNNEQLNLMIFYTKMLKRKRKSKWL